MLAMILDWCLGSTTSFFVFATSVSVVIALSIEAVVDRWSKTDKFPRIGRSPHGISALARARREFLINGKAMAEEGYQKYKDSIYVVQTADMERLILSNKYLNELRSIPEQELSSKNAQCERHLAWWNSMDVVKRSNLHANVSKVQLTQNLGPVLNDLQDEVELTWPQELLACSKQPDAYHYYSTHHLVVGMISRLVNRTLVGASVCRNPDWFNTSLGYAIEAFNISATLRPRSRLFRPFIYICMGARRRLKRHVQAANRILNPIIQSRTPNDPSYVDMLQWMVDGAEGKDKDPSELTLKILFMCLASINASSVAVTHAIFDLCEHREYIEPLRAEINEVVEAEGGFNLAAMHKMERLDSFLKESQRVNHPGLFSFNRKVLKEITLSDGAVLPSGTMISIPTYCLARDPDHYEAPETFQPFRFYDLRRSSPSEKIKHQFTTTGPTSMAFGYGVAACPGRFFAACEIKVALVYLLIHYDFQFPEGQTKRPENVFVDERINPDSKQQVGFKLRSISK